MATHQSSLRDPRHHQDWGDLALVGALQCKTFLMYLCFSVLFATSTAVRRCLLTTPMYRGQVRWVCRDHMQGGARQSAPATNHLNLGAHVMDSYVGDLGLVNRNGGQPPGDVAQAANDRPYPRAPEHTRRSSLANKNFPRSLACKRSVGHETELIKFCPIIYIYFFNSILALEFVWEQLSSTQIATGAQG